MLTLTLAALAVIFTGLALCVFAAHIPILRVLVDAAPLDTEPYTARTETDATFLAGDFTQTPRRTR